MVASLINPHFTRGLTGAGGIGRNILGSGQDWSEFLWEKEGLVGIALESIAQSVFGLGEIPFRSGSDWFESFWEQEGLVKFLFGVNLDWSEFL